MRECCVPLNATMIRSQAASKQAGTRTPKADTIQKADTQTRPSHPKKPGASPQDAVQSGAPQTQQSLLTRH